MSLLTKAKEITVKQVRSPEKMDAEVIELAVAYCKHEVNQKQVATVLGIKGTQVTSRVFQALKSGIRTGELKY